MAGFDMSDYVDVAERVQEFYAKYPDGRLVTGRVTFLYSVADGTPFGVKARARAYRTPDDPLPGIGTAWEPIPGKTSFTRDSEVQNAETAAWGRAIAATGIRTKKIASADEVRARQPEPRPARQSKPAAVERNAPATPPPASAAQDEHTLSTADLKLPPEARKVITVAQVRKMWTMARGYKLSDDQVKEIVWVVAGVDSSKLIPRSKFEIILNEIDLMGKGMSA